jgi:hypothetical protein
VNNREAVGDLATGWPLIHRHDAGSVEKCERGKLVMSKTCVASLCMREGSVKEKWSE